MENEKFQKDNAEGEACKECAACEDDIADEGYQGYEDDEVICIKFRDENDKYLEIFQNDLLEKGFSNRTVRNHLNNAEFYINDFLLYGEPISMKDGCFCIDEFLGYFFIRKCAWSTPGTIKSTAASLKKFYKCMMEHDKIKKDDYQALCEIIKDKLEDWMDICDQYNDVDQVNPFSIW